MNLEQLQLVLQSAVIALPALLKATPITLGFALAAMLLGLPLGFLVARRLLERQGGGLTSMVTASGHGVLRVTIPLPACPTPASPPPA